MGTYLAWCWLWSLAIGPVLAEKRGVSRIEGFWWSILLGPFGVVAIGLMPPDEPPKGETEPKISAPTMVPADLPARPRTRTLRTPADPAPDDFDAGTFFGKP